jgi:DNA-binding CsgD family transcriptional regulator
MSAPASKIDSKTYPLGLKSERTTDPAIALVALSHTPAERRLYSAMLNAAESLVETAANASDPVSDSFMAKQPEIFTVRRVMDLEGIKSLSTIRRGLEGLVAKHSVERESRTNGGSGNGGRAQITYRVFTPEQVIARRNERGIKTFANENENPGNQPSLVRVIQRVVENRNLSRRESQVAFCCAQGLTNAEIGARLLVTKQTVKFHLRNVFIKFGVKRRAELISRLLM